MARGAWIKTSSQGIHINIRYVPRDHGTMVNMTEQSLPVILQ